MTNKLLVTIFLFLTITSNIIAETSEIVINPGSEEYTRLLSGLSGSNTTIISREDLKLYQNKTLPQIIDGYSGIATRSLHPGYDGVYTTIDIRGFGEVAKSNSLILINGRRLNDIDMSSLNSHIPLSSIERIEIIRGGSAATLYGSGAVGGAINIVTNNEKIDQTIETSIGSYGNKSVDLSLFKKIDNQSSVSFSGSKTQNNNYRDAADFEEDNLLVNLKNKHENLSISLDIISITNKKDLPGGRIKGGEVYNYHICNRYEDSKTARNTGGSSLQDGECNHERRVDYANTDMESINGSFVVDLNVLNKIFINVGYRDKIDKSFFGANANTISTPTINDRYTITNIDGNNFNSRYEKKKINEKFSNILNLGYDFVHSFYDSKKHRKEGDAMGHQIYADLKVKSVYFQNTTYIYKSDLSISLGYRDEKSIFGSRDEIDKTAPGFEDVNFGEWGIYPQVYDMENHEITLSNQALNVGFEKKLNRELSFYGSYSESFRVPNIDERVASSSPKLTFDLKDQESKGYDIGFRYQKDNLGLNASYYEIDTKNEIQLSNNINTNLDPIERQGVNLDFDYIYDLSNKIKGSFSYTDAVFTAGSFTPGVNTYGSNTSTWQNLMGGGTSYSLVGKSVPLVAPIKFSVGYETDIRDNLTLDIELDYTGEKYVSNDQENIEPKIPDYYFVNTYLSSVNRNYKMSFGVKNIFDESAYDMAVSSTFHNDAHYGLSNVYPLPERNMFFDLAYTF